MLVCQPLFDRPSLWVEKVVVSHTTKMNFVKLSHGLHLSNHTVLIEKSALGWKKFGEVMRDVKDNVIIICSIEDYDTNLQVIRLQ